MCRAKASVLVLLVALLLSSAPMLALGEGPATSYSSHTFPRPEDFTSLEAWARSNFADFLIEESLQTLETGEYAAISFKSRSEANAARAEFNLLIDTGNSLVLLSTVLPKASPDFTPVDVFEPWRNQTGSSSSCNTSKNACNCVYFARCRVPSLPYGLTSYEDKVRIINSYSPAVGSVAIMKVGLPWGHVAVVTGVKKDSRGNVTSITVTEANYKSCQFTTRSGSPSTLKVTGYFKPR